MFCLIGGGENGSFDGGRHTVVSAGSFQTPEFPSYFETSQAILACHRSSQRKLDAKKSGSGDMIVFLTNIQRNTICRQCYPPIHCARPGKLFFAPFTVSNTLLIIGVFTLPKLSMLEMSSAHGEFTRKNIQNEAIYGKRLT